MRARGNGAWRSGLASVAFAERRLTVPLKCAGPPVFGGAAGEIGAAPNKRPKFGKRAAGHQALASAAVAKGTGGNRFQQRSQAQELLQPTVGIAPATQDALQEFVPQLSVLPAQALRPPLQLSSQGPLRQVIDEFWHESLE